MTDLCSTEGERINFRKHILRITYQNKILYNKLEAYEQYNRALIDYQKDGKTHATISNQMLGGDPAPGGQGLLHWAGLLRCLWRCQPTTHEPQGVSSVSDVDW